MSELLETKLIDVVIAFFGGDEQFKRICEDLAGGMNRSMINPIQRAEESFKMYRDAHRNVNDDVVTKDYITGKMKEIDPTMSDSEAEYLTSKRNEMKRDAVNRVNSICKAQGRKANANDYMDAFKDEIKVRRSIYGAMCAYQRGGDEELSKQLDGNKQAVGEFYAMFPEGEKIKKDIDRKKQAGESITSDEDKIKAVIQKELNKKSSVEEKREQKKEEYGTYNEKKTDENQKIRNDHSVSRGFRR